MPKTKTRLAQVMMPEELHQQLKLYAVHNSISLKETLELAIRHFVVDVVMAENAASVAHEGSQL